MQEDKEKEMTKDVVVSLKGLQLAPDQQSDAVEVIAPGEYYIRNNKHYVLFEEIMEGETQTLKNMLKFNDNYLEFTRKGPMSVHMIFEKGKKNLTYYYTPFGSIQIGIDATSICRRLSHQYSCEEKRRSSQNCIKVCQVYGVKNI